MAPPDEFSVGGEEFAPEPDFDERPGDPLEARAEEICAHLVLFTFVPKEDYRDLVHDESLRRAVRRRLAAVGLQLVDHVHSPFFAVRLKRWVEADVHFDWPVNFRLPRGAVALMVVLWAKLVMPRRAAGKPPVHLFPPDQRDPEAAKLVPSVHRDALFAEFGDKFGKVNFQRYLGQLRNLGFIEEDRDGTIREGPLLDLLVDGDQLAVKLKDSILWDLVGSESDGADGSEDGGGEAHEAAARGRDEELGSGAAGEEGSGSETVGFPDGIGPERLEALIAGGEANDDGAGT